MRGSSFVDTNIWDVTVIHPFHRFEPCAKRTVPVHDVSSCVTLI